MFIYQFVLVFIRVLLLIQLMKLTQTTTNLRPEANKFILLLLTILIDDYNYTTKKCPEINPMGLGAPWVYSYLEHRIN